MAVRGVEESAFRKFKAATVESKMRLGDALSDAMLRWVEQRKTGARNGKRTPKLKPFDWGKGTESTSREVDKLLYGGSE